MPLNSRPTTYIDTPRGIFTDAGNWFRTREAWIADYAKGVIDRESLGMLLAAAEIWIRSPQTLALWLLLPFMFLMPPHWTVLCCIGVFVIWQIVSPALVSRTALPVLKVMDLVVVQGFAFILVLSVAAAQSQFYIVGISLAAFIILRWGLLELALRPILGPVLRRQYRLPVADHILRSLIIRSALHYGVTLEDFSEIERDIVRGLARK